MSTGSEGVGGDGEREVEDDDMFISFPKKVGWDRNLIRAKNNVKGKRMMWGAPKKRIKVLPKYRSYIQPQPPLMLAAWKANRQLPNVRSFSSKASLLTILHKTSNLLPRILPNSTSWIERSSSSPPPARILSMIPCSHHWASTQIIEQFVVQINMQPPSNS